MFRSDFNKREVCASCKMKKRMPLGARSEQGCACAPNLAFICGRCQNDCVKCNAERFSATSELPCVSVYASVWRASVKPVFLLQDKRNPQVVLYARTLLNWTVENKMDSHDSQERFLKSSQTIFLMLGRLKLPALRCFCTWLAEPCRARPLEERLEVGEISTFSLSIPERETRYVTTESQPSMQHCLLLDYTQNSFKIIFSNMINNSNLLLHLFHAVTTILSSF